MKKNVIEDKIKRYNQEILIAKELSKRKFAEIDYYDELISKFEKIIKFYNNLKVWNKLSRR